MTGKSYKASHAQGTASLDGGSRGGWPADTGRACSLLNGGGQGVTITDDIIKIAGLSLPILAVKTILL